MTKKFSVQDIIDAIGVESVVRRADFISFVNDGQRKYYCCPLITFAQKRCNFCETSMEDVVEHLESSGYNVDFLEGFVYGFDGWNPSENQKTDDFLDGYRVGVEVYQYCKKNGLILFGG